MNNLKVIRKKVPNEKSLSLGLSSLHCWIRTFEYLLHLGYKNEIKKFQARTTEDKQSVIRMKDLMKRRCREELSLIEVSLFANIDKRLFVQMAKFGRTLTLTLRSMLTFGRTLTLRSYLGDTKTKRRQSRT